MALVTRVLVTHITNLTDARYCAGMGVEFLSFCVQPGHPAHVGAATYQEMIGWITGPRRVIDITGFADADFTQLLADYRPEFLLHGIHDNFTQSLPALPRMVTCEADDATGITRCLDLPGDSMILLHTSSTMLSSAENNALNVLADRFPVLLLTTGSTADLQQALAVLPLAGVVLAGESEVRPGLKDLGVLADVLEALEDPA